jgi:alkanesulfonate monooxygenase SsuD/methylene tetrahydromethanopterin reductase-like flavin-dependent oxidoreductase (luciferase family)
MMVGLLHETPYAAMKDYSDFPAPNLMFDPQEGHRLYSEYIEELVTAEKLGFDIIALPEQHSKQDNIDPSPNILISHLVGKTKKIRLLPYGAILPLHNPIRIAEEYAILDVLSKGRLLAGFIRGGASNHLAYSVPSEETRGRYEEAWEFTTKAWTVHEPFQWKGKYFRFDTVKRVAEALPRSSPADLVVRSH